MAEFYVSLSSYEMAKQIAAMINQYNRWATNFSAYSIYHSASRYFVEIEGDKVVGCAGSVQDYPTLTKIQHICVLPSHRRRGIAVRLSELAIVNSDTEYVYMTIREDNIPSIRMAEAMDFRYVTKHWFRDHWTLTFGRRRDNDRGCREAAQHV